MDVLAGVTALWPPPSSSSTKSEPTSSTIDHASNVDGVSGTQRTQPAAGSGMREFFDDDDDDDDDEEAERMQHVEYHHTADRCSITSLKLFIICYN